MKLAPKKTAYLPVTVNILGKGLPAKVQEITAAVLVRDFFRSLCVILDFYINSQIYGVFFFFPVKTEYRTHCSHHGGECMEWCNEALRRNVSNKCPEGTFCCVLV